MFNDKILISHFEKEDERRAVLERVRRENRKSEAERLEATLRAHDRQVSGT